MGKTSKAQKTAAVYENLQLCRGSLRLARRGDWSLAVMWTAGMGTYFPWGYIAAAVFPPLIHLTVVTQPYSWLFVYATRSVCLLWGVWGGGGKAGPLFVRKPKKKRKRKCAMEEPSAPMPSPVRAMLMWLHLCCYMCVKMRNHHHTPGWWDYFQEITWVDKVRGGRFLESEEARGACCGVAPTQEMMDYQQR